MVLGGWEKSRSQRQPRQAGTQQCRVGEWCLRQHFRDELDDRGRELQKPVALGSGSYPTRWVKATETCDLGSDGHNVGGGITRNTTSWQAASRAATWAVWVPWAPRSPMSRDTPGSPMGHGDQSNSPRPPQAPVEPHSHTPFFMWSPFFIETPHFDAGI